MVYFVHESTASHFVITAPLNNRTTVETGKVLLRIFSNLPERVRRTMTFDNGGVLVGRKTLSSKTGNANDCRADIDEMAGAINLTPKKCLGVKTPTETFIENINVALDI